MDWFKFYGKDWLSETKRLSLTSEDQLCYITALCMSASSRGEIVKCDEQTVIRITANMTLDFKTENAIGCFERMKRMITQKLDKDGKVVGFVVKNFKKRQSQSMTGYERLKKYRNKQKENDDSNDNDDNHHDNSEITDVITPNREEKSREIRKKRIEKKEVDLPLHKKLSYLKEIPESDLKELSEKYSVTADFVKARADDVIDYCEAKSKKYSDYKAALRNFIKSHREKVTNARVGWRPEVDRFDLSKK